MDTDNLKVREPVAPQSQPAVRTVLGFDYGRRRIGIAVGQTVTGTASPLTTLSTVKGGADWQAIQKLIETWRADALVIGVPYNMDGTPHELTRAAQRFGRRLHERFGLPVHEVDERLTSIEAENRLAGTRRGPTPKEDIDKHAAQIILEAWLSGER